jgi:hypothetical protein
MNEEKTLRLIDWYNHLSLENLNQIEEFYAKDTYFRDPFNEFLELKPLIELYKKMFLKMDNPRFIITRQFSQDNDLVLFWDFKFKAFGKEQTIVGNTLLKFNAEGKISYHLDYWDTVNELWMKVPLLGSIVRFLYRFIK